MHAKGRRRREERRRGRREEERRRSLCGNVTPLLSSLSFIRGCCGPSKGILPALFMGGGRGRRRRSYLRPKIGEEEEGERWAASTVGHPKNTRPFFANSLFFVVAVKKAISHFFVEGGVIFFGGMMQKLALKKKGLHDVVFWSCKKNVSHSCQIHFFVFLASATLKSLFKIRRRGSCYPPPLTPPSK